MSNPATLQVSEGTKGRLKEVARRERRTVSNLVSLLLETGIGDIGEVPKVRKREALSVRLSPELRDKLWAAAEAMGVSRANLIEAVLAKGLEVRS